MLLASPMTSQILTPGLGAKLPRRLLVLDDDPVVRGIIAALAERDGFQVRTMDNSNDFLREVDRWDPTHITIDLHLPAQDGVEVMRTLAERRCRAKVTIVSAVDRKIMESARQVASDHGLHVKGVLTKPFGHEVLRAALATDSVKSSTPQHYSLRHSLFRPTESSLRQALEGHEFILHFQPKINLHDGGLVGVEALVRWEHPSLGMIMPDRFIGELERNGDISWLTTQVIEQGLNWFANSGLPDEVKLSLNLSANDLPSTTVGDRLLAQCRRLEVQPDRLILELTETCALPNPDTALEQLTRLRIQGFGLALDDFGTGHSSMVHLQRHPFSSIKIDRSFVMSMEESPEARKIVAATVRLGCSLGLLTIAEGVNSVFAARRLRQMGCEWGQGYWIGEPMSPEAFNTWYDQWDPAAYLMSVTGPEGKKEPAFLGDGLAFTANPP